jgi:hypothetical protein
VPTAVDTWNKSPDEIQATAHVPDRFWDIVDIAGTPRIRSRSSADR